MKHAGEGRERTAGVRQSGEERGKKESRRKGREREEKIWKREGRKDRERGRE